MCVAPSTMKSSFCEDAALAWSSWLCQSEPASLPATTMSGCVSSSSTWSKPVNETMAARLVSSILFGAFGLALALAFGLGNRDLAGEVTREWYERYQRERADTLAREKLAAAEMETDTGEYEDMEDDAERPKGPSQEPPQPV